MPTLIELTAYIVSAHISNKQMTSDEMHQELQKVHATLKALEAGPSIPNGMTAPTEAPKLTIKQAFKKDEVICMVCGRGGFTTLKSHLAIAHYMKPGHYRKQFNIPSSISLTAKSYSESRRQMAFDKGLGEGLAKAREVRAANAKGKMAPVPAVRVKPNVLAMKVKAAVPAVRAKPPVPAVKVKSAVPAVKHNAQVPAKVKKVSTDPIFS